jgi:hypothetical protein
VPAASGSFTLFVQGDEPSFSKESLNLAAYGTANSGVFGAFHLFALNEEGPNASGFLPIFVQADGKNPASGILSLYAAGVPYWSSASFPIFAANSGVVAALNIYASGQGVTPGATPYAASLPLYCHRPEGAVLNLFVCGQGIPVSGEFPIYAQGTSIASGVLNLAVPYTAGELAASLDIYANGW